MGGWLWLELGKVRELDPLTYWREQLSEYVLPLCDMSAWGTGHPAVSTRVSLFNFSSAFLAMASSFHAQEVNIKDPLSAVG